MNHGSDATTMLDFLRLAERLKCEVRHSWLSSGRRESVAEHTWQMALMAFVTYRHLEYPVAIDRVLKMILVHDLVEAEVGDIPYFATGTPKAKKVELEQQAISKICGMLDPATGGEIYDLFQEYEALQSPEAKFAKALDNLEVQIQHNLANLKTWEEVEYGLVYTKMDRFCAHDRYLRELCAAVKQEAEAKMRSGGIDVEAVKGKVGV